MSSQKPVLNPHEVLRSHYQGGKQDDRYIIKHGLFWPATLCPLIPKPSIAMFLFSRWLFCLHGKLRVTGLFRLALGDSFYRKPPNPLQVRQGSLCLKPPDQLSRWLWLFLPFAAPSQLDAREQQPEFSAGGRCCVRVSSSAACTASPGTADRGVSAMSHSWRSLCTFPRFL